ncbi:MAG: histidine--tRNA ligase, partial [Treponema sp.]|nr:histidine--tRNA ligase [Treponema sp.]
MNTLIQPKVLKGFRDFLPDSQILRSEMQEKISKVYQSFGFVPIDTPVLEYSEILLRKSNGETEKQVYRFEDNGKRDIALRFDLTVPFARFTAEHYGELYMPFKRYHMAKVWRGEKPQSGRYREFLQCDIDTVGSDSPLCDFEIINVQKEALKAIGVDKIKININHRGIFNRFLEKEGVLPRSEDILRIVDKIYKVGEEEVLNELNEYTPSKEISSKIIDYVTLKGSYLSVLDKIEEMSGGSSPDSERMRDIYKLLQMSDFKDDVVLNPAITRGLDYYTGIVFETFLDELPSIGSICSGGRYDNLAGLYMKEQLPGVGGSIGLDRLIAGLEELGLKADKKSYLDAEIFFQNQDKIMYYQRIALHLRNEGIAVEIFPEEKKMNQQYAL